jgi:MFS family permease
LSERVEVSEGGALEPPVRSARLYYGWPMLLGLSVAETISWGILYYAFSVFIHPMESELGWSRAQVTGAFSLALLVSGLAAVPVGHWLDRHGPRGLMTLGSGAAALLLLGWSRVESLAAFYLLWAGLGLAMAAVLYEPAFAVVATWFVRHRHRALTLLTVFGGLASTVFVPLSAWLLERRGWRGAVASLAGLLALTTLPLHGLLLRRHPRDVGAEPDGQPCSAPAEVALREASIDLRGALRGRAFWSLAGTLVLGSVATAAASTHLLPYLVERGVPLATAVAAVGLLGAMQLPGRLLYVPLRSLVSREGATAAIFLLQATALIGLPWAGNGPGLYAFVILFGMANGSATLLRASAVAEAFGPEHYGRIGGVVSSFVACARAAGPVGAAFGYAAFGGYGVVFPSLALLSVLAAVAALGAREAAGRPARLALG